MNRRELIKNSIQMYLGTALVGSLAFEAKANESCEYLTPLLNGMLPENANSAVSGPGQFHHYHYLHIPQEILENPPEGGWSTLTSMMVDRLGIDDFFFRHPGILRPNGTPFREERPKQYHCHQVYISQSQIQRIRDGQRVEVFAYIQSRPNQEPRRNHQFIFNDQLSEGVEMTPHEVLAIKTEEIIELASQNNLRFEKSPTCYPVRVFNPRYADTSGFISVTEKELLEDLQGWVMS
ncbi:MAG: hypothetical protein HRT44_00705 [Bdellovibrionales bacterium]|nr:hypothetical protein [Bdellovibrionales bacterium]NQZ17771.1 hypothetical protein [Bdellovibrionales bacterium]